MARIVLKGVFRLTVDSDGDTIHFLPDNGDLVGQKNGDFRVRLEAIDAPEKGYRPVGARMKGQAQPHFKMASVGLNKFLGLGRRKQARGFIFAADEDSRQRLVAFAFPGDTDLGDGTIVELTPKSVEKSANVHLLQSGLAFPCFYKRLDLGVRQYLRDISRAARQTRAGILSRDQTTIGFETTSMGAVTRILMWPKLFRRLVEFFAGRSREPYREAVLKNFLASKTYDRIWVAPDNRPARLLDVLVFSDSSIRLSVAPEDIVLNEH